MSVWSAGDVWRYKHLFWLIDSFIDSFIDSLIDWFIDWLIDSFIDSLIDWLIDSFIHSFIHSFIANRDNGQTLCNRNGLLSSKRAGCKVFFSAAAVAAAAAAAADDDDDVYRSVCCPTMMKVSWTCLVLCQWLTAAQKASRATQEL